MNMPVIVLGAGGHSKVLIDVLRMMSTVIVGIVDSDPALVGTKLFDVEVLGGDDIINEFLSSKVQLVNGLGSIGLPIKRQQIFKKFKSLGYSFASIIHPSAVVASNVVLGEGVQIMAGTVIQPGSCVGCNTIINTRASVDHDCIIGDNVHIAPGATLSGEVKVGVFSHIGTGATVVQGISIGDGCLLAAGSVVVKDVFTGSMVRGVPAKEFV